VHVDALKIAERFALGSHATLSEGPVARGKQGTVWRLETTDGPWAVKVPFEHEDQVDGDTSAEFQEAACRAGVPAPQVRRTTDGAVFSVIDELQVRVYEWVDLLPPSRSLDPAEVGSIVARLHKVKIAPQSDPDPWYHEPVGQVRWDALIQQLSAAQAPFAGRLADLRNELVALDAWIEPSKALQTCHRDLWADNVLPTATGGISVIDWENSGPADPTHELACVLFEFARDDHGRARALLGGYTAEGGPAVLTNRSDFSMLIAQLGHITELAASDWLTPNPRSPSRADAEAWVREVLDEPHTRILLDGLLGTE